VEDLVRSIRCGKTVTLKKNNNKISPLKAQNKLDGNEYAIKKILFKKNSTDFTSKVYKLTFFASERLFNVKF
jgi:hypothetical protein